MHRVGIRDLKQRASEVIRRVAAGEEVEVTDRGRPVARIVPLPYADEYDRLVTHGEILLGNGSWRTISPADSPPGTSLSQVLLEMRDEDDR